MSAAPTSRPNVLTVPAGCPFLDVIARAILAGDLPRPGGRPPAALDLAGYTVLLPTRRAARALQEAFLRAGGGRAMLLPAIRTISEGEEDLSLLAGLAGAGPQLGLDTGLPAAIPELERRLVLTQLVLRWSKALRSPQARADDAPVAAGAETPAEAARLAADLARLMDMVETEGVSLESLARIVPDTYAGHWQLTLQFLGIISEWWPAHLAERGLLSPADRRNRVILADARRLEEHPPAAPVIVAGITGSIPAARELIRAVARLPLGAVVLPDLDLDLDDGSWAAIAPAEGREPAHPEHPQYGLHRILTGLGVDRRDVARLPGAEPGPRQVARARLVSEAMRPAATTTRWEELFARRRESCLEAALAGVSLIEAASPAEEAEAIALILREAVETPGRTAALVTPDRRLARRVAIRLEGLGIDVDDSAGRPLLKTPAGTLLDLVVEAVQRDFTPLSVAQLLKHPLVRLGFSARDIGFAARALEIAAFRTLYLGRGLRGLKAAFENAVADETGRARRERAFRNLWPEDWRRAELLVERLTHAFEPFSTLGASDAEHDLARLVEAHVLAAERLAAWPEAEGEGDLWRGDGGEAASLLLAGLLEPGLAAPRVALRDYPELYRSLAAGETVRPQRPVHPRVAIWGPIEARLQRPDLVVLGSLNDGVWPDTPDAGAWINRPMRRELGLPMPEERIGYAAHDFTVLLGADRVILTRATKADGAPTVASRWLLRLRAVLAGLDLETRLDRGRDWLAWAAARDFADRVPPIAPPEPRPPLALRPRRLSVSAVETWIADPYAIFARHILGLEALPALGAAPDAALRGSVVHAALSSVAGLAADAPPEDVAAAIVRHAREMLERSTGDARVAAFWLPRIERFASWFAETEPARRDRVRRVLAEVDGELMIESAGGPFTLTARADRIDEHADGLVITDYKTGSLPSAKRVIEGLSPQLPLEAAIAMQRGFTPRRGSPLADTRIAGLRYIGASGGDPPGEERLITAANSARLAVDTLEQLTQLVRRFDDPTTPYRCVRRAQFTYDYSDYAGLARVGEWRGGGEMAGDGDDDTDSTADEGVAP